MSDGIDEVWHNLAVRVMYIRHLTPKTCFKRGIFISFGYVAAQGGDGVGSAVIHFYVGRVCVCAGVRRYNAALSQSISDIQQCPNSKSIDEFRNVVLNSFGLTPRPPTVCKDDAASTGITIAFIRRANYKRRPGHAGDLETRLGNEDELSRELHAWAEKQPGEVGRCVTRERYVAYPLRATRSSSGCALFRWYHRRRRLLGEDDNDGATEDDPAVLPHARRPWVRPMH